MRNLWKTAICLAFIFMFSNLAQAQAAKTVTGNYCGEEEAGDGAYYYLFAMVGNSKMEFLITQNPKVRILNSKIKNLWEIPVGSEVNVKYIVRRKKKVLSSITLTGKVNKKTKPCGP